MYSWESQWDFLNVYKIIFKTYKIYLLVTDKVL